MEPIYQNWRSIQERIANASARVQRRPEEITVVAVTKTRTAAEVDVVSRCGIHAVGENRVQEAHKKKARVNCSLQWHLIGHLQSNKAKRATTLFDAIQSVDTLGIAQALNRHAEGREHPLEILVQVNTSEHPHQSGAPLEQTPDLVAQIAALSHLRIKGLMTIGAFSADEKVVRPCFSRLRQLADRIAISRLPGVEMSYLSMGMSADFECAIAEGANMLRLGTALFGSRVN